MAPHNVAVLDDYQGVSEPHFAKLDASKFSITQFKDTLLPYNHPDTPQSVKDALVERLTPFDIICTMRERTPFPKDLIDRLPNLKLLLTTGIRNKGLDLPAFAARSVPVAGTTDKHRGKNETFRGPGAVGTDSTTQHTVSLILSLARNIPQDAANLTSGVGSSLWQTALATGLGGKTLGIVGLGRLGATTARIMHLAFGMRVVAWSTNLTQEAADAKAREMGLPVDAPDGGKTFEVVSRAELYSTADVVSIHVVLSDRSRGLVNAADLALMKPSSFLVNTSRGPLVVEEDLLATLRAGKIRGAALDVFGIEPLPRDSPWRSADWGRGGRSRVVLTPHMGYVEEETLDEFYEQQVANLERWGRGEELAAVLT